jgi:DNA-binding MarR family transcriptional regulator
MSDARFPESAPQILQIIQRFIRLRKYFRIDSPQNMKILGQKLHEAKKQNPNLEPISPDLFYNVGMVLSKNEGPLTMSELSRQMEIPTSSATRIIDWMTKNDYVERLPDADDRRIVRVGLTEEGRQAYAALNDLILESFQRILKLYTKDEIHTMQRLFNKALDAIEAQDAEANK